jgi:hypothetical protein
MNHIPHDDCSPESVAARRLLVLQNHPLHCHPDDAPKFTLLPPGQALAMLLDAKEDYKIRLKEIGRDIDILRDLV